MPIDLRNICVTAEENPGPPSDASSSAMPKVPNICRRLAINPWAPPVDLSTIGQFE